MPFKKHAVVEVENEGEEPYKHYFYIDYEKYSSVSAVDGLAYFLCSGDVKLRLKDGLSRINSK